MANTDPIETAIGVAGFVLLAGAPIVALVQRSRRRRREAERRRDVLQALATRFQLRTTPTGVEGHVGQRKVSAVFRTEYLLEAHVALAGPVLPSLVRICELADGPYQKQEELHGGGAHATGDPAFDSKFLVYGPARQAQALPSELRALLLRRPIEHLEIARQEVSRPLLLTPAEAISMFEEALALSDALDELTGPS